MACVERFPEVTTYHLHLHNGRGSALTSAYVALRALDSRHTLALDTTIGGMGGCPYCGNGRATKMIPTEDLVDLLHEEGIETGIDLGLLIEAAHVAEEVVGHELYGHVSKVGPRPRGEQLYAMDMPFVETIEEAQHFRLGAQTYEGCLSPWKAPVTSPARDAAEAGRAGPAPAARAGLTPSIARRTAAHRRPRPGRHPRHRRNTPMAEGTRGSLAGLRVIEISTSVAGPLAGQILGDLGAEVIKVERVGAGDDTRAWAPPGLGRRVDRLPPPQPQQAQPRAGLQGPARPAGAARPDRLRRRAGAEPAPRRAGQGRLLLGAAAGDQPPPRLLRHDRLRPHRPEGRRAGVRPAAAGLHRHHRHDGHRRRPAGACPAVDPRQGHRDVGGDRRARRAAHRRAAPARASTSASRCWRPP